MDLRVNFDKELSKPVVMFRSFLITRYMHVLERDEGRLLGLFLYPLDNLLLCIICFLQCLFSSQIIYSSF